MNRIDIEFKRLKEENKKEAYENEFLVKQFGSGFSIIPGYNLNLPKDNNELVNLIITYEKIIESKKMRMLAIITNSFMPCNGRYPTLIAIITMFFIHIHHHY